MANNTLTAVVLKPANADFSEQYRTLTTREGEVFSVGIKEYIEGKKTIEESISGLENEKKAIDSDLEAEQNRLFEQAKLRYNEGGKWTEIENHNGEKVTHAQVSMDENIRSAKNKAENLKKTKDNQLKNLKKELETFEIKFKSVVWAWNLAYQRSSLPNGSNNTIAKGSTEVNLVLKQHLYGGGFAWLEPFFENGIPTGNTKSGLYVHTASQNAQIVTAEWYGYDKNGNPLKIDKPITPGSKVQLHIYTRSMYGHNIRIELKANGKTLKANTYGNVVQVVADKKPDQPDSVYEVIDSKDLFLSEVEIYDYSDPKSIQPPPGTVTGHLVDIKDDQSDGMITSLPNVQKAVLDLIIDPAWCLGEVQIVIKPTVHYSNQKKDLDAVLTVNCRQSIEMQMPEPGNMPVFVDKIETNFQAFHPCGYTKFEVNDGTRTIDLLEDKSVSPLDLFELVAGPLNNTHDITITLDTDTTECSFDGSLNDHEKHVLSILDYPEKKVEKDAKAEEEKGSTSFNSKVKVQIGDKTNMSHEHLIGFKGNLEKYTADGDDKELKFKARYIYNYAPINLGRFPVHPIFRYFWLGNGVPTNTYMVKGDTCRYQQVVSVKTYPDVAWSLKLSYTNSTVERELWGNQRYANTKKAKFKREPQKWTPAGEGKNIGISLGAKWDNENEYDATADITKQVNALLESLGAIGKFVNSVFLGDENKKEGKYKEPDAKHKEALDSVADKKEQKQKQELEKTKSQLNTARSRHRAAVTDRDKVRAQKEIDGLQRKVDSQSKEFDLKLTRSIGSIRIQWPQLEAQFEWSLENIQERGPFYNQTGVVLQGVLELTPLIGITATLDFLALAQRAHPVALAVIAAADITMAIIGDGSKITCELSATGTFGGKLQGFLNTKTGENSFNKDDRNGNDKQIAELKCDLEFKLEISIKIKIEKKKLFVKVTLTGDLGAEAVAKWEGKAPIDTDDYGWFLAPEMTFEGLEVKAYANVEGQIGDKDDTWGSVKSTNEFQWQAIDAWKEPKKWGKFYFPSRKE